MQLGPPRSIGLSGPVMGCSVPIAWDGPDGTDTYRLYRNGAFEATLRGTSNYVFERLVPETTFHFEVRGVLDGQEGNGGTLMVTTGLRDASCNELDRPTPPLNLTADHGASGDWVVTWDEPVSGATGYNIFVNGRYVRHQANQVFAVDAGLSTRVRVQVSAISDGSESPVAEIVRRSPTADHPRTWQGETGFLAGVWRIPSGVHQVASPIIPADGSQFLFDPDACFDGAGRVPKAFEGTGRNVRIVGGDFKNFRPPPGQAVIDARQYTTISDVTGLFEPSEPVDRSESWTIQGVHIHHCEGYGIGVSDATIVERVTIHDMAQGGIVSHGSSGATIVDANTFNLNRAGEHNILDGAGNSFSYTSNVVWRGGN